MARSLTHPRSAGFGSVLRNRHFQRLWLAQLISQTIQNATNYGSIILLAQSGSVTEVGGVVIAFSLPALIFGVPAGVLVDRFDKRAVLWVSNALRALAAFGFVAVLLLDKNDSKPIYLLTFVISIIGQFFGPAEGASIPLLVGERDLVPALSLFNITFSISQALGFVIIGPLIYLFGPRFNIPFPMHAPITLTQPHDLFLFIGIMYIVCALLIATIPHQRFVGTAPPQTVYVGRRLSGMLRGVMEAWNFVRRDSRLLVSVLQLTLGGVVISVVSVIAPLFVKNFFLLSPDKAAIVFVPAGVGLVSGSVFMPRIIDRIKPQMAVALGVVGVSSCTLLLSITWLIASGGHNTFTITPAYVAVMIFLTFGIGLGLDLITLPAQTVMQQRSPDWVKGRVLALQTMLLNGAQIPIIPLVGIAADRLTLPVALGLLAAFVVVSGLGSVYLGDAHVKRSSADEIAKTSGPIKRPAASRNGTSHNGTKSNPLPPSLKDKPNGGGTISGRATGRHRPNVPSRLPK